MATHVKSEVIWMQTHEELIVKQEKVDPLETWKNTPESSHQKLVKCKTEITHEIEIKDEPQEPTEDENLSSNSEYINPSKIRNDETSIREVCEEINYVDSDKPTGFIVKYPYCKTKYFGTDSYKQQMVCENKSHDSIDQLSKNSVSSSFGYGERQIGEKYFVCEVCNKTFNTNRSLIRHGRIHTGEKTFSCDICDKIFTHINHLTSHKRIHTGEKPFSCNLCHKKFAQQGVLGRHKRTHTGEKPFSCDLCHKQYVDGSGLAKHRRTHASMKLFSCEICHKEFAEKSTLARHMKIHTNANQFHAICITSNPL